MKAFRHDPFRAPIGAFGAGDQRQTLAAGRKGASPPLIPAQKTKKTSSIAAWLKTPELRATR